MTKLTKHRRHLLACLTAIAALTTAALAIEAVVRGNDGARIYNKPADAPTAPVAIVFGAGLSDVLADRVATGVELYRLGKTPRLLMTGDNGRAGYSEPDAMKTAAEKQGVPAKAILCDYAGFHTYDSLYRARDIFGVRRAILVTQTFHLHRALYTGKKLGLDVCGVSADQRHYIYQHVYDVREALSTIAAWVDVNITHPLPKYLGSVEARIGG